MYEPTDILSAPEDLRELLGPIAPTQDTKIIDHVDVHCRAWIERSPFVTIASVSPGGNMDVSPKGDPAGFVKVIDEKTLAIPERKGNRRGDTLFNLLADPRLALVFFVPMRREVVRVNGTALLVRDAEILDTMVVNGHRPDLAILVRVAEAFYHCGKAVVRSGLWEPEKWGSIDGLPSYAQALLDHGKLTWSLQDVEEGVARNAREELY